LREILERLAHGEISVEDAEKALRVDVVEKVGGVARLDLSRSIRRGIPEIVLAEGKSDADLLAICRSMLEQNKRVIVSRVSDSQLSILKKTLRGKYRFEKPVHGSCIIIKQQGSVIKQTGGRVGILTAGTVDLAVAE